MSKKTKKCANCQGTGIIVHSDYAPVEEGRRFAPTVTSDKACYRCKGTGKEEVK